MPKIEFLQDRVLRDEHEGTAKETVYRAGQTLVVPEESARHWTDRGVAILVEDDKPAPKKRGRLAKQEEVESEPAGE